MMANEHAAVWRKVSEELKILEGASSNAIMALAVSIAYQDYYDGKFTAGGGEHWLTKRQGPI